VSCQYLKNAYSCLIPSRGFLNYYGQSPHMLPDCPSWVPHWHSRTGESNPDLYNGLFSACARQKVNTETGLGRHDLNKLTVQGILCESVRNCSLTCTKQSIRDWEGTYGVRKNLETWFGNVSEENPRPLILAETLIAGVNARGERATKHELRRLFLLVRLHQPKWKAPSVHLVFV
jgi:hypothetical protein